MPFSSRLQKRLRLVVYISVWVVSLAVEYGPQPRQGDPIADWRGRGFLPLIQPPCLLDSSETHCTIRPSRALSARETTALAIHPRIPARPRRAYDRGDAGRRELVLVSPKKRQAQHQLHPPLLGENVTYNNPLLCKNVVATSVILFPSTTSACNCWLTCVVKKGASLFRMVAICGAFCSVLSRTIGAGL